VTQAETRLAKADRLLKSGAVQVLTHVAEDHWSAVVKGDTDTYLVRQTPELRDCECDQFQYRHECAHFMAAEAAVMFMPKEGAST
jgi:hypothetical protein